MNIYQKLIEVRKVVPYLQKENDGHQYKYVGSSQVLASVRQKMDDEGLLLIPKITNTLLHEKSSLNSKEHLTELVMEFTWINSEKPDEQIVVPWYGQGLDSGEKGVGKALTYAEKYFLLKFFNIATDQLDADSFQGKRDAAVLRNLNSNLIAQIKSEWLGAGFKANDLNAQVTKLYQCKLAELTEEQGIDFIEKIKSKKGGKAS